MKKVSVIIPAYNCQSTIRNAVGSALSQRGVEVEVVVVDDGSNDSTGAVLDSLAAENPAVVVKHRENGGTGSARNLGISTAGGEYIAFLDADDAYSDDEALVSLVTTAEEQDVDIAVGLVEILVGEDDGLRRICIAGPTVEKCGRRFDYRVWQSPFGFYACVYRAEFLRERGIAFPELTWFEDPVFFVTAQVNAGAMAATGRIVYRYRMRVESDVRRSDRELRQHLEGLWRLFRLVNDYRLEGIAGFAVNDFADLFPTVAEYTAAGDAAARIMREIRTLKAARLHAVRLFLKKAFSGEPAFRRWSAVFRYCLFEG